MDRVKDDLVLKKQKSVLESKDCTLEGRTGPTSLKIRKYPSSLRTPVTRRQEPSFPSFLPGPATEDDRLAPSSRTDPPELGEAVSTGERSWVDSRLVIFRLTIAGTWVKETTVSMGRL